MLVVGFATTMRSLHTFAGGGRIGEMTPTGAPVLDGIPLLVEMRSECFHIGVIGSGCLIRRRGRKGMKITGNCRSPRGLCPFLRGPLYHSGYTGKSGEDTWWWCKRHDGPVRHIGACDLAGDRWNQDLIADMLVPQTDSQSVASRKRQRSVA